MGHHSGLTKEELRSIIEKGWSERRARQKKRAADNSRATKRWKAVENEIDRIEASLGRTLSVMEYRALKESYGINCQYLHKDNLPRAFATRIPKHPLTPSKDTL